MTDTGAPPLPGQDSPVPADVPKVTPKRKLKQAERDALIPKTALQSRAEARAAARTRQESAPSHSFPGAAAPAMQAPRAVPQQPAQYGTPTGYPQQQHFAPTPYGYPSGPALAPAPGYPPPGYAPVPYGYPQQAGYPPQPYGYAAPAAYPYQPVPYGYPAGYYAVAPQLIPKKPFTKRQRRASLLGSLVGQTILSLATHFLGVFLFVSGFAWMLQQGGTTDMDGMDDGTLAEAVSYWTQGDRYGWFVLMALLATSVIGLIGWFSTSIWQRQAGLPHVGRSMILAWLTTTVITGFIGIFLWPTTMFVGLIALILPGVSGSLSVPTMWAMLFGFALAAVLACGAIGMLFGHMYLLASRPRPTFADLERERVDHERAAEQAAAAADAAELARVE